MHGAAVSQVSDQVILDLDVEKQELHLCEGHWKAEKLRGVRRRKFDSPCFGGGLCGRLVREFLF